MSSIVVPAHHRNVWMDFSDELMFEQWLSCVDSFLDHIIPILIQHHRQQSTVCVCVCVCLHVCV